MHKIGFHASHEQFAPSMLLECVRLAEQAGFQAAMCSDHFNPWSERQGHSGFAWSWLGAALQATSLTFGVVNAPGQRYHPAIIAQAAATLAEMFPDRFWIAIGSGEALNEHITGDIWPRKPERNQRLKECADIMRALWAGETVDHDGLVRVRAAKLYSRPAKPPMLVGAALTVETAEWLGSWADGMITAGSEHDALKKIVQAFHAGGGKGKPVFLQAAICYAPSMAEALKSAHDQWRHALIDPILLPNLNTPAEFDAASEFIPAESLTGGLRIYDDPAEFVDWFQGAFELGFERIYINHIGCELRRFIDVFGEEVIPNFAK